MSETTTSSPGPWDFTQFTRDDGSAIESVEHVAECLAASARHRDHAELWGVTAAKPDPDGVCPVICYTGNGPRSKENARLISSVPEFVAELTRLRASAEETATERDRLEASLQEETELHGESREMLAALRSRNERLAGALREAMADTYCLLPESKVTLRIIDALAEQHDVEGRK